MSQHEEVEIDPMAVDGHEDEVVTKPTSKPGKSVVVEKKKTKTTTNQSTVVAQKKDEEKKAPSKPKNYDVFPEFCIRRFIGQKINKKNSSSRSSSNKKKSADDSDSEEETKDDGDAEGDEDHADGDKKSKKKPVKREQHMFMLSALGYRKFQSLLEEQMRKVIEEAQSVRTHSRGKPVTLLKQHIIQGALLTINSKSKSTKAALENYVDEYFKESERQQRTLDENDSDDDDKDDESDKEEEEDEGNAGDDEEDDEDAEDADDADEPEDEADGDE